MAAPPVPSTASVGQKITAALWNAQRDLLNFLLGPPRSCSYQGTATTSLTSGTVTVLPLDTELYDTDTMHSTVTNTSRVVATTSGAYRFVASVAFATNAAGVRVVSLRKNAAGAPAGGTQMASWDKLTTAAGTEVVGGTIDIPLAAGDYIEMFAQQTSGGALSTVLGSSLTFLSAELAANS